MACVTAIKRQLDQLIVQGDRTGISLGCGDSSSCGGGGGGGGGDFTGHSGSSCGRKRTADGGKDLDQVLHTQPKSNAASRPRRGYAIPSVTTPI